MLVGLICVDDDNIGEILEHAVLLSVKAKDIPAFERYFAQVKPYYFDYAYVLIMFISFFLCKILDFI